MKPFLYICSQKTTAMMQMVVDNDIALESTQQLHPAVEIEGILF